MLKIKLQGGEQLAKAMREKPSTILSVLSVKLNQLMIQLSRYVTAEKLMGSPLHRRTGKLASTVHHVPASIQGQKIIGAVESSQGAGYGIMYERGRGAAWEITAVNAKALHFLVDGRDRWAKSVMHPSVPAMRWMQSSLDENADNIKTELQDALNRELKK
jgi:hypothetical protein